jgi:branched-chain amino acid transport system ATP-binding protein
MARAMLALKRDNLTMIVSEQNLNFLAAIADSAVLLERGVVRHVGPMSQLVSDESLRLRYLALS